MHDGQWHECTLLECYLKFYTNLPQINWQCNFLWERGNSFFWPTCFTIEVRWHKITWQLQWFWVIVGQINLRQLSTLSYFNKQKPCSFWTLQKALPYLDMDGWLLTIGYLFNSWVPLGLAIIIISSSKFKGSQLQPII